MSDDATMQTCPTCDLVFQVIYNLDAEAAEGFPVVVYCPRCGTELD